MKKEIQDSFVGPLFLVGMPRSGTKLLRNLLNQHPRVSIVTSETGFLPYWSHNWGQYGDLSDHETFSKFYNRSLRIQYLAMRKAQGRLISCTDWYDSCPNFQVNGVFETLLRYDSHAQVKSGIIWGDKSPWYITEIPLLSRLYPDARFIHIIRDVRDYCLSMNNNWGKNMIRAAQRWTDEIEKARLDGACVAAYMEVKYESLLEDPERELKGICEFLCIDFDRRILSLSKPSERYGDAKGKAWIVKSNRSKYESLMSVRMRSQIEEVACQCLLELGYPCNYAGKPKRVGKVQMLWYRVIDSLNLLITMTKRSGINGVLKCWRGLRILLFRA